MLLSKDVLLSIREKTNLVIIISSHKATQINLTNSHPKHKLKVEVKRKINRRGVWKRIEKHHYQTEGTFSTVPTFENRESLENVCFENKKIKNNNHIKTPS